MKVKELIKALEKINSEAETNVVAHCRSYNYTLSCGGGDGCTEENCDDLSFYVDELCTNENIDPQVNEYAEHLSDFCSKIDPKINID